MKTVYSICTWRQIIVAPYEGRQPASLCQGIPVSRYPDVPADIIFDTYEGNLSYVDESLELGIPGEVDKDGVRHYIHIYRINYSDGSHPENCPGDIDLWPIEADGNSMALTRKIPIDYGNDPENWFASIPSPGEEKRHAD